MLISVNAPIGLSCLDVVVFIVGFDSKLVCHMRSRLFEYNAEAALSNARN